MNAKIPTAKHRNLRFGGQTCLWSGTDTEEEFKKNCLDPASLETLKSFGWADPGGVTYIYNQHGFRAPDFDYRPAGLALGCSFTEGVGITVGQTWPHQLSQLCNMHVWNLGVGGTSIDTVFRLLDHYLPQLNIKFVSILIPPACRFEYFNDYNAFDYIATFNLQKFPDFSKTWLSNTVNEGLNLKKTLLAIKQICHEANVPVVFVDSQTLLHKYRALDPARDLMHPGPLYNIEVAKQMYKQLFPDT